MGGRGASSAIGIYAKRNGLGEYVLDESGNAFYLEYGDEFESLATIPTNRGEVKVIRSLTSNNNKRPYETRTPGRIYATVSSSGVFNNLYFFGPDGKIREEWNLAHSHKGVRPGHKHIGYEHSDDAIPLSDTERAYARTVEERWERQR